MFIKLTLPIPLEDNEKNHRNTLIFRFYIRIRIIQICKVLLVLLIFNSGNFILAYPLFHFEKEKRKNPSSDKFNISDNPLSIVRAFHGITIIIAFKGDSPPLLTQG